MQFKPLWHKWCVVRANKPTSCILALPGRGQTGFDMARIYLKGKLWDTLIIGITPDHLEWYPMPNGPKDQDDALKGQQASVNSIMWACHRINELFNIPTEKIALCGCSAGAVMAAKTLSSTGTQFSSIICQGGAILDPKSLPKSKNNTPVFLFHAFDDQAFDWKERYVPGKRALIQQGYNVHAYEKEEGGHGIGTEDVITINSVIAKQFNYPQDHTAKVFGEENVNIAKSYFHIS